MEINLAGMEVDEEAESSKLKVANDSDEESKSNTSGMEDQEDEEKEEKDKDEDEENGENGEKDEKEEEPKAKPEKKNKGKGRKIDEDEEDEENEEEEEEDNCFREYHEYNVALRKAFEAGQVVVTFAYHEDSNNASYLLKRFWTPEIEKVYKKRKDMKVFTVECDGKDMTHKLKINKRYPTVFFYEKGAADLQDYAARECFHKEQPNLLLIAVHEFVLRSTDDPDKYIYMASNADDLIWRTPFVPEMEPIVHPFTQEVVGHELCVLINNEVLLEYVRKKTRLDLYGDSKKAKFYQIEMLYEQLKAEKFAKTKPFQEFNDFILDQTRVARENAQKMISEGCIAFKYLKYLFKVGDKIIGTKDKLPIGGVIKKLPEADEDSYRFEVEADVICTDGQQVYFASEDFSIYKFYETKKLTELDFHHITEAEIETLAQRFAIYLSLCCYKLTGY